MTFRHLARTITALSCGDRAAEIAVESRSLPNEVPPVVGFTGPPGVGKSTLIAQLLRIFAMREWQLAVVVVDPSDRIGAGGAILGDRVRFASSFDWNRVFIRSLASRGALGGLTDSMWHILRLLRVSGFDLILLETVGTGQNEIEISDFADINIILCAPDLGDEIQGAKSGVLEIADAYVITHAGHPKTNRTVQMLRSRFREGATQHSLGDPFPPIFTVEAENNDDVAVVSKWIDEVISVVPKSEKSGRNHMRAYRLIEHAAGALFRDRLAGDATKETAAVIHSVEMDQMAPKAAAQTLLQLWRLA